METGLNDISETDATAVAETAVPCAGCETLRHELRTRDARDTLTRALKTARSPDLLFEAAREMLQFDDEGRLANTDAILTHLGRRYPEQFETAGPPSIGGGAGTTSRQPLLTKETLAGMKPEEIARLDWAAVKQALSDG